MATVAFIGLGVMGYPMAGHLSRAGHPVACSTARVHARSVDGGISRASVVRTPAMLPVVPISCSRASATTTMCAASRYGDDGALSGHTQRRGADRPHDGVGRARPGACEAEAKRRGAGFLDAPVSGGQAGAENGQLTVMVGGDADAFAAPRPWCAPTRVRSS